MYLYCWCAQLLLKFREQLGIILRIKRVSITFYRCLLDAVIASMDATISRYGDASEPLDQKKENTEEMRSSGQTARMLALMAYLINQQSAIKAAFLQICRPGYAFRFYFCMLFFFYLIYLSSQEALAYHMYICLHFQREIF